MKIVISLDTPSEFLESGDLIFGGWVNLGSTAQTFVCKPRSHLLHNDYHAEKEGFARLTAEEIRSVFDPYREEVSVLPGQLIIFSQTILHEVTKKDTGFEQLRLFLGWRITRSDRLLFDAEKRKEVEQLRVPRLPSGQVPPMYSANHGSAFKNKPFKLRGEPGETASLLQWLRASFVSDVKRHFDNGEVFTKRAMKSLSSYGMGSDYAYDERDATVMLNLHDI